MTDFSDQFRKIIMRYKRIGYNLNVMRQSACLVINPITVDGYAALFNCTPVDRASDSMMVPTLSYSFYLVGTGAFVCCLVHRAQLIIFFCFRFSVVLFESQGSPSVMQHIVSVESSSLLLHTYLT